MSRVSREVRQLSRYGTVGLATNLSLYVLFVLLLRLGVQPVPAAGICYVIGVCASYVLNRAWSFASRDSHRADLPKFLLAYCIGLCSTLVTMHLLIDWLRPEMAQVINIGLTAVIIYATLSLLRFGGKRAH